ncbi:MAG: twin-arginine translocation signal domain-containing protein, partial [Planctomycetota bacterium]|nr:twin-arginine translocation signal domain-containing protein [Planctomycetota bacterium]
MSDVNPILDHSRALTRRAFFGHSALGVGAAALSSLFTGESSPGPDGNGLPGLPHHAPKAKRVI